MTLRSAVTIILVAFSATVLAARREPQPTTMQMPAWPQQFTVRGAEVASFGFAVTQPGPISVDLQVQGAPVIASVRGAASQPVGQQGTGALRLTTVVSPNDIQASPFWVIDVRLAIAAGTQAGVASGTINVQAPPANPAQVQGVIDAATARATPPQELQAAAARSSTGLRAQLDAELQQQRQQLDQQLAQRRAGMMSQLQPAIDRMHAMNAAVGTRAVAPGALTTGRTAAPIDRTATMQQQPTATSSQPLEAAGGGNIQSVAPNPAIMALSVSQAMPGDTVMITGTAFGTAVGTVHFVVGPGREFLSDPRTTLWNDSQVFAVVPVPRSDAPGTLAFNGAVYVERPDKVKSNLQGLAFQPLLERRQITAINGDFELQQTNNSLKALVYSAWPGINAVNVVTRQNSNCFSGISGSDRFYANTRLKNGWKVTAPPRVFLPDPDRMGGNASLAGSRVASESPFTEVAWWMPIAAFCSYPTLTYAIAIPIEGPLNTPDGVTGQWAAP